MANRKKINDTIDTALTLENIAGHINVDCMRLRFSIGHHKDRMTDKEADAMRSTFESLIWDMRKHRRVTMGKIATMERRYKEHDERRKERLRRGEVVEDDD